MGLTCLNTAEGKDYFSLLLLPICPQIPNENPEVFSQPHFDCHAEQELCLVPHSASLCTTSSPAAWGTAQSQDKLVEGCSSRLFFSLRTYGPKGDVFVF